MKKILVFALCLSCGSLFAAVDTNTLLSPAQYEMMEPYLKEKAREKLRPKDARFVQTPSRTVTRSASNTAVMPLSNFSRPSGAAPQRRVVARSAVNNTARAAANATGSAPMVAATSTATSTAATSTGTRRVVQRSRSGSRVDGTVGQQRNNSVAAAVQRPVPSGDITPEQCFAYYTECMDGYCRRQNTKYDRCYCSAKLQQIDGEYKPAIDALVRRIGVLANGGDIANAMTQEEINEYWKNTFDSDSMANLSEAVDISWAGTESSVRGQNAFVTGDDYCKQYLSGCFYMAENMKSMYRTTIGQDCKRYETYLQKMKYAAEQIVAHF
jgi:hypothetical protein